MILNEPSDLRLANSHVQEPAINGGQYCIYAHTLRKPNKLNMKIEKFRNVTTIRFSDCL